MGCGKIYSTDLEQFIYYEMIKKLTDLTVEVVSPEQIDKISDYLNDWENISFDDKRQVLYGLIVRIRATSENVEIEWKI